jgi:hypothetical protein
MEPLRARIIDQFSSSSAKPRVEDSSSSSFTDSPLPSPDEPADDFDDKFRTLLQAKPDIVPFQGDDTVFPVAIHLPPNNTEIKSYSALYYHLQQSPLLFEAF